MKLRITLQGTQYDVDVDVLDDSNNNFDTTNQPNQQTQTLQMSSGEVVSPISGTVFDIRVKPGDIIKVNDTLLVLEAMKMESNIVSTISGKVREICVKVGDSVTNGQVLVRIE